MTLFQITRITATNPPVLSKEYGLNPDGTQKKTPGGPLIKGTAEKLIVFGMEDLAETKRETGTNQAWTYGVTDHDKARILTKKALAKSTGGADLPYISRSRDFFKWPDGPGILLLDFDSFRADHADEIKKLLAELHPALETAPCLIFPSSSSGLYHGETCLKGLDGWRALVLVADASDIPRTGKTLFNLSWLQGRGFIHISESGAQLVHGPLDGCVWTPERLDFVSGAHCIDGIEQRQPDPVLYNKDAAPLDTGKIKNLTPAETLEYEKLVRQAKKDTRKAAQEQRERWIENCIEEKLAENPDATEDEIEQIRQTFTHAAKRKTLFADFVLHTLDGEPVTVAEVMENREDWHLKYIRDPLEPFGENSRARLHLITGGRPYIWSFYQQTRFTLTQTRKRLQIIKGARVEAVENLLDIAREDGGLFIRGGEIVAVSEAAEVTPLDIAALQYIFDGMVSFEKWDARSGEMVGADCPKTYADGANVAARLNGGLPKLTGIITHPTIDPKTGRIIYADGYDAETKLLLRLNGEDWPTVPDKPTVDETKKAVAALLDPFLSFPFAGPVDRGVYLAAILTAVIRGLLDKAPLFMITAPTPGTGKTLLSILLARIIGIKFPSMFPFGGLDEAEIRKRLLSIFRTGARLIILDNIRAGSTLNSESLDMALTNPTFSDRVLGVSNYIKAPANALMIGTGNNIRPGGDTCRRTVTARLVTELEKPWTRTFDENIIDRIDRDRVKMITAALTVLKGTLESGFTVADGLGSFEDWNATARAAVCYAASLGFDVSDPAESIETSLSDDPETGKLRALLAAWFDVFGDAPTTVAACISAAELYDNTDFDTRGGMKRVYPALFDACDEIAGERGNVNPRRLGHWIIKNVDRIIDGKVFQKTDIKTDGVIHWRVKNKS